MTCPGFSAFFVKTSIFKSKNQKAFKAIHTLSEHLETRLIFNSSGYYGRAHHHRHSSISRLQHLLQSRRGHRPMGSGFLFARPRVVFAPTFQPRGRDVEIKPCAVGEFVGFFFGLSLFDLTSSQRHVFSVRA